jgi:putative phosphoesterase
VRLGVIADTHGHVPASVHEIFDNVDHIIHGGDIGTAEVLIELEAIAPVTAVYGNMDGFDIRSRCPGVAKLELDDFYITVTHGDRFGSPTPAKLHKAFPEAEIIVFGHTHRPLLELVNKTITVMNPGSASAPRHGMLPTVGIMELEPAIPPRARLVQLQQD